MWILRKKTCQLVKRKEPKCISDLICIWNLKKNEQRTDWCLPEAGEMVKKVVKGTSFQYKITPGDMSVYCGDYRK